jgi:hypothetical protein
VFAYATGTLHMSRNISGYATQTFKDFPDEPRRAPVLQGARQLRHGPGHGRQDIGFEIAALIEGQRGRRMPRAQKLTE